MAGYQVELNHFIREVYEKEPSDFLQFAANYFNKRLEHQRVFVRNQESLALSKGIVLFPSMTKHDSVAAAAGLQNDSNREQQVAVEEEVLFKSPFVEHDPQSAHLVGATGDGDGRNKNSEEDERCGIFKGDFHVGKERGNKVSLSMDPVVGEIGRSRVPRGSFAQSQPLPINFNAQRRTSVSGETLQPDRLDDWEPESFSEKTADQISRLEKAVGKNFLFNKLDTDAKKLVINSLQEKFVSKGQTIIVQGDEGDYFYIVEDGTVEFFVNNQKVNTSGPGSSFGELALMYNSPRAATVLAATDCILWTLDRLTFRKILLGGSFKKRILYDDLLQNIPLLKNLSTYDRAKLADALDTEYYEPGQTIIKEGDNGENFYFIEYGTADVSKKDHGLLTRLKKGDYFGEVALLNDLPRQATVTATTQTKVATLGKSGFQRLLGPVVEVLKLNDPTRTEHKD